MLFDPTRSMWALLQGGGRDMKLMVAHGEPSEENPAWSIRHRGKKCVRRLLVA